MPSDMAWAEPVSPGGGASKAVALIAEDPSDLRMLLAQELTKAWFRVVEANDGPRAIQQAHRFAPHAIRLDLMLPGINGFAVARLLREDERTRDAAIIAVTGVVSETFRATAMEVGCDLFIRKPVVVSEVVAELVQLLDRRRAAFEASPEKL